MITFIQANRVFKSIWNSHRATWIFFSLQEYMYPDARNRQYLLSFHRRAKHDKFDVDKYNTTRETMAKLEHELDMLRNPIQALPAKAAE